MTCSARLATATLLLTLAACAPLPPPPAPGGTLPAELRVRIGERGPVRSIPIEEYVSVVVLSEVAPDARDVPTGERMLEVQAIIARTYAVAHRGRHRAHGYDLCATTHCQVYATDRARASVWRARASGAVRRTAGVVLWHGDRPAAAVFHADCGGATSAARDVWGGAGHPYLAGGPDDGPASGAHFSWRFEIDESRLRAALDRDARTRVGGRLQTLRVVARDGAGRAAGVEIVGRERRVVRGEDLRAVLMLSFGDRSLRSTRFDLSTQGNLVRFDGRGFGHGVGLCQAGALARLRAGATPSQVLAHYYPGTIAASGR
jgi:stage II sporulation protein D